MHSQYKKTVFLYLFNQLGSVFTTSSIERTTWGLLGKVGSAVAGYNPRLGVRFSRVAIPHTFERRYKAHAVVRESDVFDALDRSASELAHNPSQGGVR
jgi:hypothetical protein